MAFKMLQSQDECKSRAFSRNRTLHFQLWSSSGGDILMVLGSCREPSLSAMSPQLNTTLLNFDLL